MSDSGTLTVYTTGSTDTYGFIFDSSGNVLAENDDGGEGWNFRVSASVSAGTYYIQVGGFETGDYTLHVVGPLDLVVSASVSDSTLAFEQPFTLRATVRNQGGGEPDPTVLFYYSSTDATITSDDTQISADVVNLETSGLVTKSLSLTAPAEAGTYYYGVCVQSVSGEHDTTNNCSDAVRVTVSSEFAFTPSTSTLSHMYWTDPDAGIIYRANLDGSNAEPLITRSNEALLGLALDVAGGQIYWTAWTFTFTDSEGGIYRANLDGSNVETLVTGQHLPYSLALDVAGGQIYWTAIDPEAEEGGIYRANLGRLQRRSTHRRTERSKLLGLRCGWRTDILDRDRPGGRGGWHLSYETWTAPTSKHSSPNPNIPFHSPWPWMWLEDRYTGPAWTAIDPEGFAEEGSIYRANLDGSNVEALIAGQNVPGFLALDGAGGQIYWTAIDPEGEEGSIYRANLNGSNVELLITGMEEAAVIVLGP